MYKINNISLRKLNTFTIINKVYYSSVNSNVNTIGFIGLGQMGFHMANNLYKKSQKSMILYDTNQSTLNTFQKDKNNVTIASSPLEVAKNSQVIVTMLPASKHVKQVYLGDNGLISGLNPGTLLIDSSTIEPSVSKDIATLLSEKACTMVDAPVSGGILGAEAGALTFMVGSKTEADFSLVKTYLELMGKNIVYCGSNGNGQVAKICNNMLLGIGMIGTSEAMNLGKKLGMDPKLLASILNTSSGRCWSSDTYNPCPGVIPNVPSSRGYTGGFGVSLMAKDMGLAVDAANSVKANVMLGAISQQIYNRVAESEGYNDKDFSSVYKWMGGESADK